MSLKDRLNADLKDAMKSKDTARRDVIRSLQAAIKQVEVDKQTQLDDDAILSVLQSEIKKRRESIEAFESGGRDADAETERQGLAIVETYMPAQLSREEIKAIAETVIAETGASSMKDMGQVMGIIMARVKGQADGRQVNEVVRELLS